jgi:hypothetical protein
VKPGGVLLVLAGIWVLCQVLGGSALKRLGLEAAPAGGGSDFPSVPDKGYNDVPHNAQGYPL